MEMLFFNSKSTFPVISNRCVKDVNLILLDYYSLEDKRSQLHMPESCHFESTWKF